MELRDIEFLDRFPDFIRILWRGQRCVRLFHGLSAQRMAEEEAKVTPGECSWRAQGLGVG